jgi:hypothetical protein
VIEGDAPAYEVYLTFGDDKIIGGDEPIDIALRVEALDMMLIDLTAPRRVASRPDHGLGDE